ncbi:hypothetical protein IF1G_05634 [Cordyceps javanica]|uniref:Uncharacterized protein n=1 Tax=Cordyceps javanica TaxID=43265 RepID=A0A545V253_9HYPO|nr:hypothetical protein IF1G_05634 [Cordyceps javanica]TQW06990.1 hypothetical protein IF2G_05374 [Cordyceps javanica]
MANDLEKAEPLNVIEKTSATKQEKEGGEPVPDWEVVHSGEARIEGAQQGGTVEPQHAWSRRSQFTWDVNWGGRKYNIISWDFTVKF